MTTTHPDGWPARYTLVAHHPERRGLPTTYAVMDRRSGVTRLMTTDYREAVAHCDWLSRPADVGSEPPTALGRLAQQMEMGL